MKALFNKLFTSVGILLLTLTTCVMANGSFQCNINTESYFSEFICWASVGTVTQSSSNATYYIYWGGVSGPMSILSLTGYGACGGNRSCYDGYEILTSCQPEYALLTGNSGNMAWAVARVSSLNCSCTSNACPPSDPVPFNSECVCMYWNYDARDATGPCN
jgi:hypothetical protein